MVSAKIKKKETSSSEPQHNLYYTLAEDCKILSAVSRKPNTPRSLVFDRLSRRMCRESASLRNRYERHLSKLSSADTDFMRKAARPYPNHYAIFDNSESQKSIRYIAWFPTAVHNRDTLIESFSVKSDKMDKVLLKKPSFMFVNNRQYSDVLHRLKDSDVEAATVYGEGLLKEILDCLIEDGHVTTHSARNLLRNAKGNMNLHRIFNELSFPPKR